MDTENEEPKVALEVAENEYDRFLEAMDIDIDEAKLDAEDLTQYQKQRGKILKAIVAGDLVVNENGEAVYTPSHKESKYTEALTFHERTGASLMAMDGKKKNYDVAKTYAIMGDMCRVHPGVFSKLAGRDIKISEALFSLLMD